LQLAHGPDIPRLTTPGTALFGLVVSDVWECTPLMALLLLSALQAIPPDCIEAEQDPMES
jgi:ABC-type sugar transport system permease subunit